MEVMTKRQYPGAYRIIYTDTLHGIRWYSFCHVNDTRDYLKAGWKLYAGGALYKLREAHEACARLNSGR